MLRRGQVQAHDIFELVFINSSCFEQAVIKAIRQSPTAKTVLVIGNGINRIDATGEETLRALARDLRQAGITLALSGLKKPVREAIERAGTDRVIGRGNLFPNKESALAALHARPATPA